MKHYKIKIVSIVIILLAVLLCTQSCGRRHPRTTEGRNDWRTEQKYNNEPNERHHSRKGRSRGSSQVSVTQVVYQPVYFNQNIHVNQNVSFQEALYTKDPSARKLEQKYDVGGTKLIAEMSADVAGIYCSRDSYSDVNINILSLDQLKLNIDNSTTSIYQQIINQQIVINNSRVGFIEGSSFVEIFENIVDAFLTGKLVVHLTIANITNKAVICEIKQGQMLEAVKENVQNLVVAETSRFSIAAHQQTSVDIRVYCAAHHRGDPSSSRVRFTPYFLNASSYVYESQSSVWSYIENGY